MEKPNLNYLKEISGGDIDFENSMLSILKTELPEELSILKSYYENSNYEELSLSIHKIKHKIGMLGMPIALEFASKIENDVKKGNLEQYTDLIFILERINVYLKNQ
ncbi:Hpt domain-containing protein [uncultured Polaribacter sp.]|uniref:Hpt domain-containing protein n=1 Tax=uncultured Polaribacter sp. TaxID=174711 RepID=UPI0026352DA4|nr:Hpt domain-containing protein [uncultured Polaribacter sp.]